ncbi:hypothetical protein [Brevibacterium metallidurans]|uniref:Uncharacterized protein n=1 Tax=Brevibacterium metallidurans TaxID=1482676 RepID=A0ABN0SP83_9MICO
MPSLAEADAAVREIQDAYPGIDELSDDESTAEADESTAEAEVSSEADPDAAAADAGAESDSAPESSPEPGAESDPDTAEDPSENGTTVVLDDESRLSKPVPAADAAAWDAVVGTVPGDVLDAVTEVRFFTDGAGGDLAAVEPTGASDGGWRMLLDTTDSDPDDPEFIRTIVHEAFHIVTLGDSAFTAASKRSCPTLYVDEGCFAEDAVLFDFWSRFWSPQATADPEFVNSYAETDVVEDASESFTQFVLSQSRDMSAPKVAMFAERPELVNLRARFAENIRANLPGKG